jgi:hypothetical protein
LNALIRCTDPQDDDGLGLRLEVDGVGHDCLLLRATVTGSSADGTTTLAHRPASIGIGS